MRLIDRIRGWFGITVPHSLSSDGWDEWHDNLKRTKPFGFWVTETLRSQCSYLWHYTLGRFPNPRRFWLNAVCQGSHVLRTRLPLGEYQEVDTRMLHGCFEALVDFVEVECANHYFLCGSEDAEKSFNPPWWMKHRSLRWRTWRCPEAGVAYLDWCMSLDDPNGNETVSTNQAHQARIIFKLYLWWKYERPQRPDPYACYSTNSMTIEQDQASEDDDMLVLLVKTRRYLWT
jgi:hypothetical protein